MKYLVWCGSSISKGESKNKTRNQSGEKMYQVPMKRSSIKITLASSCTTTKEAKQCNYYYKKKESADRFCTLHVILFVGKLVRWILSQGGN
jgi:hypothetical protein